VKNDKTSISLIKISTPITLNAIIGRRKGIWSSYCFARVFTNSSSNRRRWASSYFIISFPQSGFIGIILSNDYTEVAKYSILE
jgi:hypothetical protein